MDEERDLVVFEDDAGNEITMEVLDYLCYEGKEYALLTEYVEEDEEADEDEAIEVMIMEVAPVGDDQEEFLPIDDELADKIMAIFDSNEMDELLRTTRTTIIAVRVRIIWGSEDEYEKKLLRLLIALALSLA